MREEAEPHIPPDFQAHITPSATQCLIRTNWEDVFDFISQTLNDAGRMLNYLRFKTLGYDANGVLKKAFNIV
jgi:hypothetical protein